MKRQIIGILLVVACLLLVACGAEGTLSSENTPTDGALVTDNATPSASPTVAPSPQATPTAQSATTPQAQSVSAPGTDTATAEITPEPTDMTDATAKPKSTRAPAATMPVTGEAKYMLYLEKGSFTLTVFGKDDEGNYTKPIKRIRCAIGKTSALTPAGLHKISTRERWHQFGSDRAYAQYVTKYASGRYIHSPLYPEKDETKMYKYSYNEIGTEVTGGCLRMTTGNALWIYNNCPSGTLLYIVNGSPLGTSSSSPPALDERYPHRDPTDPFFDGYDDVSDVEAEEDAPKSEGEQAPEATSDPGALADD